MQHPLRQTGISNLDQYTACICSDIFFDMDVSYAWVLLLKVAHRNLTVYVTRYGVRAHNVVQRDEQ
jgi:hypothetical protein